MSDLQLLSVDLTAERATELTEKAKDTKKDLIALLRLLHDGKAYKALGYATWAAYVHTEFDISVRTSYRLMDVSPEPKALPTKKKRGGRGGWGAMRGKKTNKPPVDSGPSFVPTVAQSEEPKIIDGVATDVQDDPPATMESYTSAAIEAAEVDAGEETAPVVTTERLFVIPTPEPPKEPTLQELQEEYVTFCNKLQRLGFYLEKGRVYKFAAKAA